MQCFRLPHRISDELGAMALVNPLAASGLLERVKALHAASFVSTAAASALGQMLLRLGRSRGLDVIHVVRRPEQVDLLTRQGATHVLSTAGRDFQNPPGEVCRRLPCRVTLATIRADV